MTDNRTLDIRPSGFRFGRDRRSRLGSCGTCSNLFRLSGGEDGEHANDCDLLKDRTRLSEVQPRPHLCRPPRMSQHLDAVASQHG